MQQHVEGEEARGVLAALLMRSVYHIECIDKDGNVKWVEDIENIVVNEGLNDLLDKYFKGSGYTAAFYVGLVEQFQSTEAFAAGDTAAQINGTNGWQEDQTYSEAVRQTLTLGSVSGQSVDNSASKASFSINGTTTLEGAFVITDSTKGGTAGVLYGEAAFSVDRSVQNGDTLNVTVTLTAASA